jgi:hypothetical protein
VVFKSSKSVLEIIGLQHHSLMSALETNTDDVVITITEIIRMTKQKTSVPPLPTKFEHGQKSHYFYVV